MMRRSSSPIRWSTYSSVLNSTAISRLSATIRRLVRALIFGQRTRTDVQQDCQGRMPQPRAVDAAVIVAHRLGAVVAEVMCRASFVVHRPIFTSRSDSEVGWTTARRGREDWGAHVFFF